jgi:hypothetical protein
MIWHGKAVIIYDDRGSVFVCNRNLSSFDNGRSNAGRRLDINFSAIPNVVPRVMPKVLRYRINYRNKL